LKESISTTLAAPAEAVSPAAKKKGKMEASPSPSQ
jgi:hypothetical protein